MTRTLVRNKETRIVYRVEPSPTPGLAHYWRAYRQLELNDGTFVDAWYGGNPMLLRKADCEPMEPE